MKNLLKVLVMIPCLLFLVNCSKSSKSNNQQCYQQQVGTTQTYYNPACTTNGVGQTGYGQVCNGIYWYQGQPVRCFSSTRNCANFTLQMNVSNDPNQAGSPGQTVLCQ